MIPPNQQEGAAVWVLILAIGLANWAQFARTVRGATMVERQKDYVAAARILGVNPFFILLRHVCPTSSARCWSSAPSGWRSPSSRKQR
jgi:peptide/nickel transport system permease protein